MPDLIERFIKCMMGELIKSIVSLIEDIEILS